MDETQELLEEGKILERMLLKTKQRLRILSKASGISIDLDNWELNDEKK